MSKVLPFARKQEAPCYFVERLQQYDLFEEVQFSTLQEAGMEKLAEGAFPIYRPTSETAYFAASLIAALREQFPQQGEHFPSHVKLEDLLLDKVGDIDIPSGLARTRLNYLKWQKVIGVENDYVELKEVDKVLKDYLHARFGQAIRYGLTYDDYSRERAFGFMGCSVVDLDKIRERKPSIKKQPKPETKRVERRKLSAEDFPPESVEERRRASQLEKQIFFDGQPFADVYREYYPMIRDYLAKKTKSMDSAEDIATETFLKVWKYHAQYQDSTNLKAWIYKVAVNTFINWYRKEKNKREVPYDSDDSEFTLDHREEFSHNDNPERLLAQLNADCRVREFVREVVPDHFLDVTEAREIGELTYPEIAEKFGIPLGTVMSRLHRARKHLKKNAHLLDDLV